MICETEDRGEKRKKVMGRNTFLLFLRKKTGNWKVEEKGPGRTRR